MASTIPANTVSPFSRGHQHRLKYQAILSEAAKLFNWQGSRATTLADIAGSMNLTKTCLYYYVKTKEELIYQCYVASCESSLALAQAAADSDVSSLDKIIRIVTSHFSRYIDTVRGIGPQYAMLMEIESLDEEHRLDILARRAQVFEITRKILAQGIKDGEIIDLDPAVLTMAIYSVNHWIPAWLTRKKINNSPDVTDHVLDILVNGFATVRHEFRKIEFPRINNLAIDSFDREAQNRMKREAFYRVGTSYFNQKGYKGTSLDEIAQSLEVTKGAFYYHIKNKEELLYQCFNRTLDVERLLLAKAGNVGETGLEKVELSLRYLFNVQFSDEGPLIRYRSLPSLDEPHRKAILKATQKNSDTLGGYIREGFADKTIRPVDAKIAEHILKGAVEVSPDLNHLETSPDSDELSAAYFHLFLNGLAAH